MKKTAYRAAAAILIAAGLFCLQNREIGTLVLPAAAKEEMELILWYPWTDKYNAYEKAFLDSVSVYNQAHSEMYFTPRGMEMEIYRQILPANIASNDMPDIYFCYGGAYLHNIAASDRLLNLDPYVQAPDSEQPADFQKSLFYNGKQYAFGFAENIGIFLVNTELFQQYQCSIPETWEELLDVCRVFLENDIVPLGCSKDADIGFRMYLEQLCMEEAGVQNCLNIILGNQEPNEAFAKGVEKFTQLLNMGAFGTQGILCDTNEVQEDFYLGHIPMYFTKSSFIGNVQLKNNPLNEKLQVVSFPGNNTGRILGGAGECFVVNAEVEHPKETADALSALLRLFSERLETQGWGIPIRKAAADSAENPTTDQMENRVYMQTCKLAETADESMPFWEQVINGKRLKLYEQASWQLANGEITAAEFVRILGDGQF